MKTTLILRILWLIEAILFIIALLTDLDKIGPAVCYIIVSACVIFDDYLNKKRGM